MPLKSEPFTRVTQGCLVVHAEMTVAFPLCFKMTGAMSNHHYCGFTRTPVNHCSIFFFFAPKICIEGRGKAQGDHPWKIFLKLFLKSENTSPSPRPNHMPPWKSYSHVWLLSGVYPWFCSRRQNAVGYKAYGGTCTSAFTFSWRRQAFPLPSKKSK